MPEVDELRSAVCDDDAVARLEVSADDQVLMRDLDFRRDRTKELGGGSTFLGQSFAGSLFEGRVAIQARTAACAADLDVDNVVVRHFR